MGKLKSASMLVVVGLLGLVFAVGYALAWKIDLPPHLVLPVAGAFAIVIVFIQFLIGPAILDWIIQANWTSAHALGPEFADWHRKTCGKFKIPEPRIGVIEDGMPNAFTYGHGPWNARVVITRGLIDTLEPDELKAVYAHELGHVKHRDFIVMTIIQALVLVLWTLARGSRFGDSKNVWWVAVAAYIAYWASYFISLLFSRIREYMADYASAQIMEDPNHLSRALVKIAYGLAQTRAPQSTPAPAGAGYGQPQTQAWGQAPSAQQMAYANAPDQAALIALQFKDQNKTDKQIEQEHKQRQSQLRSLGAFGIAGSSSMRAAVSWYAPGGATPENFTLAARWELYNPWAKVAEFVSTHPLTAYRIMALQKLNRLWNKPCEFDFSKIKPAKYHRFFVDLLILMAPAIGLAAGLAVTFMAQAQTTLVQQIAFPVLGFALGGALKLLASYPMGLKSRARVLQLLGEVDVSHINAKPVQLEGVFTGRLEAGFAWANDFILQDDTGFVACVYKQPLGLLEVLFGLFKGDEMIGRPVIVHGWYRRFGAPFIEIDHFVLLDTKEKNTCWARAFSFGFYLVLMVGAGAAITLAGLAR